VAGGLLFGHANDQSRRNNVSKLRAGLIDELHLAIRPVLLGSGEHLFNDIDMHALGYACSKYIAGERATHDNRS
jgi:dihydrofolate reductase